MKIKELNELNDNISDLENEIKLLKQINMENDLILITKE